MRQAGRYLPEYRQVRQNFKDFMAFCLTPEAVTQVTLQPIERFDFDAAIIFCDILIIPHLLGQTVHFIEGEGPRLATVDWKQFLEGAKQQTTLPSLQPVFEAIRLTRQALPKHKSLIGFCGSPWTIACYMLQGGKVGSGLSKNWDSNLIKELVKILQHHAVEFLLGQIHAGCDVVQIFDSWASLVPSEQREEYLWQPLTFIYQSVRKVHPNLPIIYYGRSVSEDYPDLADQLKGLCFGLDQSVDPLWAAAHVQSKAPVQGNLDPISLIEGGFEWQTDKILQAFSSKPFVFNLGHGILPQTPLDSVYRLVEKVRCKLL
jgi:uroporphyrinogen decarboxylase